MRIVFMGSPVFAVPTLESLVREGHDVVAVYTQPDRPSGRGRTLTPPPVKKLAEALGIEVRQPEKLREEAALAGLRELRPDVIIVCAYGQILSQAVLDIPPKQCINVHFSLLPRHRGATPVAAAILAGDDFTGVSIQLVRLKLDTGPLLASGAVPVMEWDTTQSLMEKLSVMGAALLLEALNGWERGERVPLLQDDAGSTYISQISKETGLIDWELPAEIIRRQVRAYHPWPGSYSTWKGKKLKILEAEILPGPKGMPGIVVAWNGSNGIDVQTGDGLLRITRMQLEGKRAMSAAEFMRGQPELIGDTLGRHHNYVKSSGDNEEENNGGETNGS